MLIDVVFSGGGIKGLAYVGAYEVLEGKGYKFKRVAGTSAGSIMAAFIAAGYTSKEISELLMNLELETILDEPNTVFLKSKLLKWLPIYWRMGLYKGQALEDWIYVQLDKKGIRTFGDLPPGALKVVASDLTNGKIMVLPDDLYKYNIPFEDFPVAKAIRMSCSLPYFFEPVRLKTSQGNIIVVDGGVLSNFPMWLFDDGERKNARPIIGIKLSPDYKELPPKKIKNAFQMFEALFSTMKDAHDARYVSRRHEKNIIFIPTKGILTTEFGLSDEMKEKMILEGKQRTMKFWLSGHIEIDIE